MRSNASGCPARHAATSDGSSSSDSAASVNNCSAEAAATEAGVHVVGNVHVSDDAMTRIGDLVTCCKVRPTRLVESHTCGLPIRSCSASSGVDLIYILTFAFLLRNITMI